MFNLAKTFSVQNTMISRSTYALIFVAQSCICGPIPLLSFISSKCAIDKASTTCCSAGAPVLACAGASPCGLPAPVAAAALLAALLDATTWDATANFAFFFRGCCSAGPGGGAAGDAAFLGAMAAQWLEH